MLGQGFSALLTLGLRDSVMRGVPGPVGCGAASLVSTRHVPGAPSPPSCDNQLKTLTLLRTVALHFLS